MPGILFFSYEVLTNSASFLLSFPALQIVDYFCHEEVRGTQNSGKRNRLETGEVGRKMDRRTEYTVNVIKDHK